jgi:hypothetical protein
MSAAATAPPAVAAPAGERAAFIRRTYLHLAGAVLACAAVDNLLLRWPGAPGLIRAMTRGYNWLIVLALFFGRPPWPIAGRAAPRPWGGCVRSETMKMADRWRGRPGTGFAVGQAAASSAMTAAQRAWKRRRFSTSALRSPH